MLSLQVQFRQEACVSGENLHLLLTSFSYPASAQGMVEWVLISLMAIAPVRRVTSVFRIKTAGAFVCRRVLLLALHRPQYVAREAASTILFPTGMKLPLQVGFSPRSAANRWVPARVQWDQQALPAHKNADVLTGSIGRGAPV